MSAVTRPKSTKESSLSQKHFRQQSSKSAPLKVSGKENVDIKRNQSKDEKSHEGEKRKIRRPIEGVAQKKLVLKPVKKKPVVKEVVKPMVKPLPFITKTNLYDEHWMMKQERGFMRWLNFILSPIDDNGNTLSTQGKTVSQIECLNLDEGSSGGSSSHPLTVPFHLSRKRLLSRWRQATCCLFQSEPYTHVVYRLEIEIETGRLAIRTDHSPHSDIGAKQKLMEMLMCYNPTWLRLGLETLFGEQIEVVSSEQSLSQVLCIYANSRLLANAQIDDQYYHPCLMGQFGEGYNEALCQFILKKFLLLVLLLDKAKLTRLVDHDPCLFVKDAPIKSSREMLLSFSRNFLSGEGDLTRHLQHLGFSVSHAQTPLDEFNYLVNNLATDLQDGLRLTRLIEILTNNWKLSEQLRVPATTKMQKLHNIEVALEFLSKCISLPAGVTAQSIAEGHREKTLTLLWAIIFNFKVKLQLSENDLKEEIVLLSHEETHPIASQYYNPRRSSVEPNIFFQSSELSLLLQWCRGIGRIYGVPVNNFNSSFSDGRILCYLLHHYQPGLLPLDLIHNETTISKSLMPGRPSTPRATPLEETEAFDGGWIASFSPTTGRDKEKERLLANEKANFKLLAQKLPLLGGVPLMLLSKDMSNTLPDEKVVIACVSYLCHQLLLLRKETRAVVILQKAWRRVRANRRQQQILAQEAICKTEKAVVTIQAAFRGYRTRSKYQAMKNNAIKLQRFWRSSIVCKQQRNAYLELKKACIVIQSHYRRHKVQQQLLMMNKSATCLQSCFRMYSTRNRYLLIRRNVIRVQVRWRAILAGRKERKSYLKLQHVAITIQSHFRRQCVQQNIARQNKSAIIIQAALRCHQQRKRYIALKSSTIVLQKYWNATLRAKSERRAYLQQREATITIQSYIRRWQVQRMIAQQHRAATTIQSTVRCHLHRQRYIALKRSTLVIQYRWRATLLATRERMAYLQLKRASIVLQSHVRRWRVQREISRQHKAATLIQSIYRCYIQRKQYIALKYSTNVLQCYWRASLLAKKDRMEFLCIKQATITIQSHVRRWQVEKMMAHQHRAATIIQAAVRCRIEMKRYSIIKHSVCVLQCYWRATMLCRREREAYIRKKQAAIIIQANVRRWQVQRMIAQQHKAAITIQSAVRCHIHRRHYLALKQSATTLQYYWRATLSARRQQQSYIHLRQAVIVLQSHFRRWQVEKEIANQHKSAIIIQAIVRCHIKRKQYIALKHIVTVLQDYWRATLMARRERETYLQLKNATIIIQSHFRRYKAMRMIAQQKKAACIIQAAVRCHIQRKAYLEKKRAVIVIQSYFRKYQEAHFYERRINRCANKIQAVWKGYRARKRNKSKAVAVARRRIQQANKAAKESNTLRNRLPSMLDALHHSRYLSTVVDILKSFELMTSVSQICCSIIVEGNALVVLYDYIDRSNRSRATLEVVKICLQILLNVMKWPSTQHVVLIEQDAVSSLIDFMQKVYVTQPDIMYLACKLLHTYSIINPYKQFSETCHRKLLSMQSVLNRKIKMQAGKPRGTNHLHQTCLQYLDKIL